ncbi:MAG TPA: hypothetical protein VGU61_19995 [Noviherbaspirillum sp.]|jgi:DNA mismatch repair protein MutH|uniref:hypothetical protein n=1 Tax=Noviherbaspirillum sp. TaxID=1926288 RepID=UPI002DDDAA5D|nr:hypothetical protein [Noviherbaspirillum sp.]HEV2612555.1 hypothetical protein [Noviherbaspirillum sp.]
MSNKPLMTDRQMLELAAKAADITGTWAAVHQAYGKPPVEGINTGSPIFWNPLTDDGDALRLAVKLDMDIICEGAKNQTRVSCPVNAIGFDLTNDDRMAATRRAIVRAAVAIGSA